MYESRTQLVVRYRCRDDGHQEPPLDTPDAHDEWRAQRVLTVPNG